jgi:hypothetical protein
MDSHRCATVLLRSQVRLSRKVLILLSIAAFVAILGVAATVAWNIPTAAPTCHDRLTSGPNSNTSRLDTTLRIAPSDWPEVDRIVRAFATENRWDVLAGLDTHGEPYAELCDPIVTTIRVHADRGEVEIQIIHMDYFGPGKDGWQPFYRDLHARLEARWPERKMTYVEGEFGRTIPRPDWLGPIAGTGR